MPTLQYICKMAENVRAVIVDDEEGARDVLANLLSTFCPNIEVIGAFPNVEIAVEGIKRSKPDLVFLDIEMPTYAGHEIVSFFDKIDFEIIFVTAYDSYAVKAFEVSAVDYLLKPVDIERLKEATNKAIDRIQTKERSKNYEVLKESLESDKIKNLVIAEKGDQNIISVDDIIAIEAQESYSCIYTANRKYLASKNLKHFETVLLDNKNFFRTHKSWVVNLEMVEKYSKSTGEIPLENSIVARLSKYRKEEFEKALLVKA